MSWSAFADVGLPPNMVEQVTTTESWTTEENRKLFVNTLVGQEGDLVAFQSEFQKQIVHDYVPIEARIGVAMMNGLTYVANILDTSLVRFMIIFIVVMYMFWIMLEAYNMMSTDNNVQKLLKNILKKTIMLIVWIIVLEIGPGTLFMYVVSPIISLGTYISDFILNAITQTAGISIPDTCSAIHAYTDANMTPNMIIDANATADLLCVPTRLSGFFVTAIATGWKWMIAGIGHSVFTFVIGAAFVFVFAWNTWKFALMALTVAMNLFLSVLLLPFTALAETVPQTSYKGIIGNIFNSFIGLFKTDSIKLDKQINNFINASVYFVSLSIVIAVCAALLSGVMDINTTTNVPTLKDEGFIPVLLTGALVAWLANKADKYAGNIGGNIPKDGTGKNISDDIQKIIKNTYDAAKSLAKTYSESKK